MANDILIPAVVLFLLGIIIGIVSHHFFAKDKVDAIMSVDISDPEKDQYNLIVLCPLEKLRNKKYLNVQVKKVISPRDFQGL